jgi:hypothetical protein
LPPTIDALRGCAVFPCVPGGKVPALETGWKEASADSAVIAAWASANPSFNWAVACGLSGLFVLDIDPEGLAWWHELIRLNADVAAAVEGTFQVRTPRGGLHIYFRGQGPSTASRIAKGIDTRGGMTIDGKLVSGGYVVLPGSRTDKGYYEAINANAIAELPDCIKFLVPERKKAETHGLDKNPDLDKPRNISWALDLLKGYVEGGRVSVQGQGGNDTAFRVAASILDKAISPATCFDLMMEHWNPHCSPPWEDWELETVIRNAAAYGEDTGAGVKGFQANGDAFANFAGQEFEAPKPERRHKLQWLHDYADNVSDPTWLIPGILPSTGIGMMYGPSGSYKSFLALDMALCLAYGHAGQWGAPPVKNDVLFFAGEGPVATSKKRWPAWLEHAKIENRDEHRFLIMDRVPLHSDTDAWEAIKADLAELDAKPALIVIDTLARLLTGLDENSAKDITMVTGFLESLARYYECFVLVIHHTGKDEKKGARGSSALLANVDASFSTTKKDGGSALSVVKQKDADVPDTPHYFKVVESAHSIVLQKTDALADGPKTGGKAIAEWATANEIVAVLNEMNAPLSTTMLAQEIASRHPGLERSVVQRKLSGRDDLKWLQPTPGTWQVITAREFDL